MGEKIERIARHQPTLAFALAAWFYRLASRQFQKESWVRVVEDKAFYEPSRLISNDKSTATASGQQLQETTEGAEEGPLTMIKYLHNTKWTDTAIHSYYDTKKEAEKSMVDHIS